MSRITAEFVAALARVWHRIDPGQQKVDPETLAQMLAPMDDAGEALSEKVEFDMEPSDYLAGLAAMADDGRAS